MGMTINRRYRDALYDGLMTERLSRSPWKFVAAVRM